MRLILVIHGLGRGGAERVLVFLAEALTRAGHEVTLLLTGASTAKDYSPPVGVAVRCLNERGVGLVGNMRLILRLAGAIREVRPDRVLSMLTTTNILTATACAGSGVKVFVSERTAPNHDPAGRFWRLLRPFAYGRVRAVITQTEGAASWTRRKTLARRVEVIPNPVQWPLPEGLDGVDPGRLFAPARKLLLCVGRLGLEKRFERAIEAFSCVADQQPDWDLAIVGEGPMRTNLSAAIDGNGLTERVQLVGAVGNLPDWYKRASLLVLTSEFEGFPNVIVEALSYGLPVIAVDCDYGPRDIVRDGIDGILVQSDDKEALVQALSRLMSEKNLREEMAQCAVNVRERLSPQRIILRWLTALELASDASVGA